MDNIQTCCSCCKKSKKATRKSKKEKQQLEYSKKLISDVRILLWVVTLGGLFLAGFCIHKGFLGSLPWVSAMVGLPWTAHGTICSFYLNMAKSDHREGGITYEKAKANNFTYVSTNDTSNINSPSI